MTDLGFVHRYRPPASPSDPTLLLLHGTGGNEDDLLPLAPLIDRRAGMLSPRGKVLERGMPRFFRRLAEGVFDVEDLVFRTSELADFVAAAAAHYGFDPALVIAAGFSNGANIAASTLLLRPGTLRAAMLFSAMVPLTPPSMPDLTAVDVFLERGPRRSARRPGEYAAPRRHAARCGRERDASMEGGRSRPRTRRHRSRTLVVQRARRGFQVELERSLHGHGAGGASYGRG